MIDNKPIINVNELSKIYGSGHTAVKALDQLSFSIKNQEFVVFMGPSGAGKSTLINMLAGLDTPTKGEVDVAGKKLNEMNDDEKCDLRRETIGIVFQFFNLHPGLTVAENIELPLLIAGVPKKDRKAMIDRALELVDIKKRSYHYPNELSGGEQQKTAIARALVIRPKILLADEPTGDLDSDSGQHIIDLLHDLNKQEGLTIIQVTHDESMLRLQDRLIQMEDGQIIRDYLIKDESEFPEYDFLNNA